MQEREISREIFIGSVRPVVMRFAAYTLVIFIFTASLTLQAKCDNIDFFKEDGPIEWMQFSLLVVATAVFVTGSSVNSVFREIFLLLASVFAFAAVRELDRLLDEVIPWIGWKIGFAVVVYAVVFAYKNRHKLRWQIAQFLCSPAFAVLWAGFVVAVPVAQLLGHGPFLESLMGDDYNRCYKLVIEESGELVGYIILVAGSFESVVLIKGAQLRKLAAIVKKDMATQQLNRPDL